MAGPVQIALDCADDGGQTTVNPQFTNDQAARCQTR